MGAGAAGPGALLCHVQYCMASFDLTQNYAAWLPVTAATATLTMPRHRASEALAKSHLLSEAPSTPPALLGPPPELASLQLTVDNERTRALEAKKSAAAAEIRASAEAAARAEMELYIQKNASGGCCRRAVPECLDVLGQA